MNTTKTKPNNYINLEGYDFKIVKKQGPNSSELVMVARLSGLEVNFLVQLQVLLERFFPLANWWDH